MAYDTPDSRMSSFSCDTQIRIESRERKRRDEENRDPKSSQGESCGWLWSSKIIGHELVSK